MQTFDDTKKHKFQSRTLDLIGQAKLVKLDQVGYVEKKGRSKLLRGQGNVEIFFPDREDRRTVRYDRRVFRAKYARYLG